MTPPNTNEELRPCPLCASTATLSRVMGENWVECRKCAAATRMTSDASSVKNWNARPLEDALRAENERLREELNYWKANSESNAERAQAITDNFHTACVDRDRYKAALVKIAVRKCHGVGDFCDLEELCNCAEVIATSALNQSGEKGG